MRTFVNVNEDACMNQDAAADTGAVEAVVQLLKSASLLPSSSRQLFVDSVLIGLSELDCLLLVCETSMPWRFDRT